MRLGLKDVYGGEGQGGGGGGGAGETISWYYLQQHMFSVKFYPFTIPKTKVEDSLIWIKLCGGQHEQLNVKIKKYMYKHSEYGMQLKHLKDSFGHASQKSLN